MISSSSPSSSSSSSSSSKQYQKIENQQSTLKNQSSLHSISTSTSYLDFHEDQEFKKVQKHLETLALRESIRRKSIRNHSNLNQFTILDLKNLFLKPQSKRDSRNQSDSTYKPSRFSVNTNTNTNTTTTTTTPELSDQLVQSPVSIESELEQKPHPSSLGIEFTEQDILSRSERVPSAFIEHCQWTQDLPIPSSSSKPKKNSSLLTKVAEEVEDSSNDLDLKIISTHHRSSIDTILPTKSSKYYSETILNDQKSSKYFSGNSFDTLVCSSNKSSQEFQSLISNHPKSFTQSFVVNSQQPLLKNSMKFDHHHRKSYQLDHRFDTLNEFDEDQIEDLDTRFPTLDSNHPSSLNYSRKISFLDWVLCSCCISNDDLNDQFDQIGKTCPE